MEKDLAVVGDKELALYELETRFAMAVRQRELLESYIKERLHPDKHFYTVGDEPGRKPSLTKEGAELICLPHALKGHYQWLSGPENPPLDDSPYQITMKCELETSGNFAGEGVGSASSMLTKKDGTRVQRQKDPGLRHNATIKMACKSAYIAATLNSTAASEFFTQDLEDDQTGDSKKPEQKGHWCAEHKTVFFMKGKMKSYAHPIEGTDPVEWCHEHKAKEQSTKDAQADKDIAELWTEPEPEPKPQPEPDAKLGFDPVWLLENLTEVKWNESTVKSYLKNIYKVDTEGSVQDVVARLNKEQKEQFFAEIQKQLDKPEKLL